MVREIIWELRVQPDRIAAFEALRCDRKHDYEELDSELGGLCAEERRIGAFTPQA